MFSVYLFLLLLVAFLCAEYLKFGKTQHHIRLRLNILQNCLIFGAPLVSISKQCMESCQFHSTYTVIFGLFDDGDISNQQNFELCHCCSKQANYVPSLLWCVCSVLVFCVYIMYINHNFCITFVCCPQYMVPYKKLLYISSL